MTQENHEHAQNALTAGCSDYLRQRLLEDAQRDPFDAAEDAITLCRVLQVVHAIFTNPAGLEDVLARRLAEDLTRRLSIDECLAESQRLLEASASRVGLDVSHQIELANRGREEEVLHGA